MKLITVTMVTVDGVMQGLGRSDEDRRGGFERGGWVGPMFDEEASMLLNRVYEGAEAFLFGRRTYEIFARSWGTLEELRAHPIGVALNEKHKYVASKTMHKPEWADTTVLSADVAGEIRKLKAQPGGELQVHGSGEFVRWLLDHELVDEIMLFVCPAIIGQGTRLFPERGRDMALEMVESRTTPKGITVQVYRPTGRPKYDTASPRADDGKR